MLFHSCSVVLFKRYNIYHHAIRILTMGFCSSLEWLYVRCVGVCVYA